MNAAGTALTTWDEFVQIPDEEEGMHYELHDGEVVVMPPPKPIHVVIQILVAEWFTIAAQGRGRGAMEFSYRPAANLQFWRADVAYIPNEDLEAMWTSEYLLYSPPLIVEVLSPSNRPAKTKRQRLVAFSAGTREFWVVDPIHRIIEVSLPGKPSRIYTIEETIPISVLPGANFPVRFLFK